MNKEKLLYSILASFIVILTQIMYSKLFGMENTLIGMIMSMAAISFLNKGFTVRPTYKAFTILLLNLFLGICAYIGSLNIYIGLIINLFTIFFITYIYMNDFSIPTSYIFLMGYIFIWGSPISIDNLPKRLFSLAFGVVIIILVQFAFNKNAFRKNYSELLIKITKDLINEIENLKNNEYETKESIILENKLRKVLLLINSHNYKRFYSSIEGKLILSICISLERLNIIVNEISKFNYDEEFIIDLYKQLNQIILVLQDTKYIKKDMIVFDEFITKYKKSDVFYKYESVEVIKILRYNIKNLNYNNKKHLKYINKEYNIPKEFTHKEKFRRNFNFKSIIFIYSIKLSIIISLSMFFTEYFNLQYGKWIVLTIYVIMQPYSEDTISKSRKRLKGTILGIILFMTTFTCIQEILSRNIILFIAFLFYYYFDDYSKKVICMTVISLTSISLFNTINILSINRLLSVIIGIMIALVFNKHILPYNINNSIEDLKNKYNRVLDLIKIEIEEVDIKKFNEDKIIKLILLCNEIENKLICNNQRVEDKALELFLIQKNKTMSDIRFLLLKKYYQTKI